MSFLPPIVKVELQGFFESFSPQCNYFEAFNKEI
jgi:hypothetical protein